MSKRIGLVGLGIMGSAISGNFLKSGYTVTGFDLDPARCDELAGKGGTVAASPAEVARASDIVITSLPTTVALDAVCTGDNGIASAGNKDVVIMECSTFPIEDKQRNHDALAAVAALIAQTIPAMGSGHSMAAGVDGWHVEPIFTVGETISGTTGALNPTTAGD